MHCSLPSKGACEKMFNSVLKAGASLRVRPRTNSIDGDEDAPRVKRMAVGNNEAMEMVIEAPATAPSAMRVKKEPITILMALSMVAKEGWEALPRRERRARSSGMAISE